MDYSGLQTAILDWSARPDLTAYVPSLIEYSTSMFNNGQGDVAPLRTNDMIAVTDLTPVSGVCALPADYLQYRRVVEKASIRRELSYVAPTYADQQYPDRPGGMANDFTIIGSDMYLFPVTSADIELTYYQTIPDLSVSNTTNWLLTKAPQIYIHAGLLHLAMFIRDDELLNRSTGFVQDAISKMQSNDTMANYARAAVRMGGVRP